MLYVVFKLCRAAHSSSLTFEVFYGGVSKEAALEKYTKAVADAFNIKTTKLTEDIFLIGLDTDQDASGPYTSSYLKALKAAFDERNIEDHLGVKFFTKYKNLLTHYSRGGCMYTLKTTTKHLVRGGVKDSSKYCECCGTSTRSPLYKTTFNKDFTWLCDICWAEYIGSEVTETVEEQKVTYTPGLAEYAIGIANGIYKKDAFTNSEQEDIQKAWEYVSKDTTETLYPVNDPEGAEPEDN